MGLLLYFTIIYLANCTAPFSIILTFVLIMHNFYDPKDFLNYVCPSIGLLFNQLNKAFHVCILHFKLYFLNNIHIDSKIPIFWLKFVNNFVNAQVYLNKHEQKIYRSIIIVGIKKYLSEWNIWKLWRWMIPFMELFYFVLKWLYFCKVLMIRRRRYMVGYKA